MKDEKPSDLHSADHTPEAVDLELRYQAFLEVLFGFLIFFADFAEHPSDGFVDEVVGVV